MARSGTNCDLFGAAFPALGLPAGGDPCFNRRTVPVPPFRARCAISVSRLYLITPPEIAQPFAWVRTLEEALDAGDVACLQIRVKGLDDDALARLIDLLRPPAQ
ncbi:MAG: Thiamine-phosphate synthase, partial [Pseudomonadota bacterium]